MGQTIITVHGVGQAEPGAISKTLAATLNFGVCTEVISVYRGFRFLELRDNDSARSIVEVNWSDLVKPRSSGVGVIRHVWYLLTGRYACRGSQGTRCKGVPLGAIHYDTGRGNLPVCHRIQYVSR